MKETDATVMAVTFAKTIARIAEFAVDLAESLHKDLGLEYQGPSSAKGKLANKKRARVERDPNEPKKKNPVIVAGKDASQVDNDYFLVPVPIRDHGGPLRSSFAVENRLLPQGPAELAAFLSSSKRQPAALRLADFHLLLWLAKQPSLSHADVAAIAGSVAAGEPVGEGYMMILESLSQG